MKVLIHLWNKRLLLLQLLEDLIVSEFNLCTLLRRKFSLNYRLFPSILLDTKIHKQRAVFLDCHHSPRQIWSILDEILDYSKGITHPINFSIFDDIRREIIKDADGKELTDIQNEYLNLEKQKLVKI